MLFVGMQSMLRHLAGIKAGLVSPNLPYVRMQSAGPHIILVSMSVYDLTAYVQHTTLPHNIHCHYACLCRFLWGCFAYTGEPIQTSPCISPTILCWAEHSAEAKVRDVVSTGGTEVVVMQQTWRAMMAAARNNSSTAF